MSGSGNGVDIGSVYQLLLRVAETVDGLGSSSWDDHTRILNEHSRILKAIAGNQRAYPIT